MTIRNIAIAASIASLAVACGGSQSEAEAPEGGEAPVEEQMADDADEATEEMQEDVDPAAEEASEEVEEAVDPEAETPPEE